MKHHVSPRSGWLYSLVLRSFGLLLILATVSLSAAMGIIMPIYGNTSSQFNAAEAAARRVPLIAVFNPSNGPGSSKNSSYAASVKRIQNAGGRVIGYIATEYAQTVSLTEVKSQMDLYKTNYGVDGYFLDEMSTASSKLSYYKSANSYAARKSGFIVGNPGTSISSSYLGAAQILITFENPINSGWSGASSAGDPSRYGAIPYSASNLGSIVTQANDKRFGWIYVTNYGEPDPFGKLPLYWEGELQAVERLNLPPPPPLPPALPSDQFRISAVQNSTGGGVSISFPAVARRRYGIQVSTDLLTWAPASTPDVVPVLSEITPTANGPVTLFAAPVTGFPRAFYRAVDLDSLAGN